MDEWEQYIVAFGVDAVAEYQSLTDSESDRSVVLITAAFIDDILRDRLKLRFTSGSEAIAKKLFEAFGPLASTSAKIEILFCLGDIDAVARESLHAIRQLRNHCAHSRDVFEFDSAIQSRYISRISYGVLNIPLDKQPFPIIPRNAFRMAVFSVIVALNLMRPKQRESQSTKVRKPKK
jgi:hypothetical protein